MNKSKYNQKELESFNANTHAELLKEIEEAAISSGLLKLALVGGYVRDIIIAKKEMQSIKDIDLIIEGSAEIFANKLKSKIGSKRISKICFYNEYDTVSMTIDNINIDLASTRIEEYLAPGENPVISKSSLKLDLSRRDFSVNAIAFELLTKTYIDPYKGRKDIIKKELVLLHPHSIKDDPTRIIRAARYSARLGFKVSSNSLEQIQSTLKEWPWAWQLSMEPNLAPPALAIRLYFEFKLLFQEDNWQAGFHNLQKWGALILLDRELQSDKKLLIKLKRASRLKINLLTALIVNGRNSLKLAKRLNIPSHHQELIRESIRITDKISSAISKNQYLEWDPYRWCMEIEQENVSPESIALTICTDNPNWRELFRWWSRWRHIKSPISANELIKKGFKQGPAIGTELKRLRENQIKKLK